MKGDKGISDFGDSLFNKENPEHMQFKNLLRREFLKEAQSKIEAIESELQEQETKFAKFVSFSLGKLLNSKEM